MLAMDINIDDLEAMTKDELLNILDNADDPKFHTYDRRYKKSSLREAVYELYESIGGEMQEIEEGADLTDFNVYQVRYIGTTGRQQIRHNWNSTPSGEEYEFPLGTWIEVNEIDYKEKYLPFVENAVEAGNPSHWEVRRYNPKTDTFVNLFKKMMDKIRLTNKPTRISELNSCTIMMEDTLRNHHIMSIAQLKSMPVQWITEVLKIDSNTAAKIMDECKEALE